MPIVIFYQEVLRCLVVIFHYVSSVIFVLTFATFIRTRWLIVSILLVGPWEIFYSTVFLVRHRYGSNAALRRLQAISMASVSWPFFHVLCFLPCTPPVLFIQTRQRIDAPKAPDLQPLVDLLQALLELLAQAGLQPLRLCFVQLLQSCNLESIPQGLVLFCIDAKFCK